LGVTAELVKPIKKSKQWILYRNHQSIVTS